MWLSEEGNRKRRGRGGGEGRKEREREGKGRGEERREGKGRGEGKEKGKEGELPLNSVLFPLAFLLPLPLPKEPRLATTNRSSSLRTS